MTRNRIDQLQQETAVPKEPKKPKGTKIYRPDGPQSTQPDDQSEPVSAGRNLAPEPSKSPKSRSATADAPPSPPIGQKTKPSEPEAINPLALGRAARRLAQEKAAPGVVPTDRKEEAPSLLKVTCEGADTVPLASLKPLQGGLKRLSEQGYQKLRRSLIKYGISFPFFVWRNGRTDWILDGTQRDIVLQRMQSEGWQLPKVPVAWIQAKSEVEAREKLLLASSRYGMIVTEGFIDFTKTLDLTALEPIIDIPELDWKTVGKSLLPAKDKGEGVEARLRVDEKIMEYTDAAIFPSTNMWGIPDLDPEMMSEQVPDTVFVRQESIEPASTLFIWRQVPMKDLERARGGVLGFYVWDVAFEDVWNAAPYLTETLLKQAWGSVISPNFSCFRDDPLAVQLFRIYQNRWCNRYWQKAGIKTICDIDWGDQRTHEYSVMGVPHSPPVISIQCQNTNTYGDVSKEENRAAFTQGLAAVVEQLKPQHVLLYAGLYHKDWLEKEIPHGPKYIWLDSWIQSRRALMGFKEREKGAKKKR